MYDLPVILETVNVFDEEEFLFVDEILRWKKRQNEYRSFENPSNVYIICIYVYKCKSTNISKLKLREIEKILKKKLTQ